MLRSSTEDESVHLCGFGMTFEELYLKWEWKPIRNCPGRYTLVTTDRFLPVQVLIGDPGCEIREYSSPQANDLVLVFAIQDGGIISYKRKDGTFTHTLNTSTGFLRKVAQLGIEDVL